MLTKEGLNVVIYQYADEDFTTEIRGFHVQGVGNAKSPDDILLFIDKHKCDYENDILIFATDFMITRNKFRHSIAIQHGVAWDMARNVKISDFMNYMAIVKNSLRAFVKFRRFKNCNNLVCVDYNFINWYRTQVNGIDANFYCIPNYAKTLPENFRHERKNYISVIFARRLVDYRGTKLFADTTATLLRKFPDLHVTIAGTGPEENYMRDKLSGSPNVKFTRYDPEDSIKFHSDYDIAVVPTINHEGTSLSLLEAMSAGCAVIATNVGGMTNIVIDGYNGLMINPLQSELQEALEKLIVNEDLRKALGAKARETVEKGFSFEKWREKWLNVIDKI